MKKMIAVLIILSILTLPTCALASFINIDITELTDEDLSSLLEETTNLATAIRKEQNDRDYERALEALGDSAVDPVVKSYEGVYQEYSTFSSKFDDDSFIVIKDGLLYEYSFTFESQGKSSITEWDLVSYDAPGVGILYCDKEEITQYTTGEKWYVYNGGMKLDVTEDGVKCLREYELSSKSKWRLAYDTILFLPVTNITKEELDIRHYTVIGKPEPAIGMTAEEVLNSKWGSPKKKNTTMTAAGVQEQWVYDSLFVNGYIYFTNGIVTSIQY